MKVKPSKDEKKEDLNSSPENNFENIVEPENFFIATNYDDDLILSSKEDAKILLENLRNSKYNKKLAEFISKFDNDIKDWDF